MLIAIGSIAVVANVRGDGWLLILAADDSVAAGLLNQTYDRTYRAARYEAYPSPRELGRTLKLVPWYSDLKPHLGMALARTGKYAEAEKWLSRRRG